MSWAQHLGVSRWLARSFAMEFVYDLQSHVHATQVFRVCVTWTCFVMHVGFVKDWNSCEKSGGSPAEHRRSVAGVDGWGSKGRGLSPGTRLLGE